ncbi:MAG: phage major capsid protein [Nitrospira sp.]|nr:phage major capsid protein [Nitrospira sp.]
MYVERWPHSIQGIRDVLVDEIDRRMDRWVERQEELARPKNPRLNLARAVVDLSYGKLNGEDREVLEETAKRNGKPFDSQRPFIEFRDLVAAVGSAGGYLKSTEVREVVDILRPWSVVAQAGMLVEDGLVGDQAIPKITQKSTPQWVSTEGTQVTPSQPTLSQIAMTPKTIGDVIQFSRQLAKQANAPRVVGRELLRTLGTSLNQAVISGSGASGQPLGLLNTVGVQTQSGSTLNAGVSTMKRKSAEANVADEHISFLSTPAVRELLEGRERAAGGGSFVWDKDQVADRRAFVSTDVPTATMICGDFSLIYLGIWGKGFVLEVNPFDPSGFKTGTIQARMLVTCDIAVLHPNGFVVASSIT